MSGPRLDPHKYIYSGVPRYCSATAYGVWGYEILGLMAYKKQSWLTTSTFPYNRKAATYYHRYLHLLQFGSFIQKVLFLVALAGGVCVNAGGLKLRLGADRRET